jgi:hypothetical protein
VRCASAEEVAEAFDSLTLVNEAISQEQLVRDVSTILRYSVRTSHPHFYDKLYGGASSVGCFAELLMSTLNANVHTFQGWQCVWFCGAVFVLLALCVALHVFFFMFLILLVFSSCLAFPTSPDFSFSYFSYFSLASLLFVLLLSSSSQRHP